MARWDKLKSRGSVDDRRGLSGGAKGLGGAGLVGVLVLVGINLLTGGNVDLNSVIEQLQTVQPTNSSQIQPDEFKGQDDYEVFASTILGSSNSVWEQVFASSGNSYTPPTLVLFRNATQSGCGYASSAVGPHYCPNDQTIYLDETFFDELTKRFGAEGGDVAEAYVIAHEVGHHVQQELGILSSSQQSNDQSIKTELQADCFAGVWAFALKDQGIFEQNEINEAIDAAGAVGDDRIQETVEGRIDPESWTHGSSDDRKYWFKLGYDNGDPAMCKP